MTKLNQTDSNKLVGLLRGEVGEIIEAWILLRYYDDKAYQMQSHDIIADCNNQEYLIINKTRKIFSNDIIQSLSELSSSSYGQLNFNFAGDKLKVDKSEIKNFTKYIKDNNIEYKRNNNISHKKVSPLWNHTDPNPHISRPTMRRAIGMVIKIMKSIDHAHYGDDYKKIWKLEREKRYKLGMVASAKYLMLPLSVGIRK